MVVSDSMGLGVRPVHHSHSVIAFMMQHVAGAQLLEIKHLFY